MPTTKSASSDPTAGPPGVPDVRLGGSPPWPGASAKRSRRPKRTDAPNQANHSPRAPDAKIDAPSLPRRWHWPHMSIRMTVLAAIAAGVVLPGLGMLWADARTARGQIDPLVEHRREHALVLVAAAVAEPWHRGESAELASLQSATLRDPLICSMELRSATGSGGVPAVGSCASNANGLWLEQPVVAGGQQIGTLRLGFDSRVRDQLLGDRQAALLRLVAAQVVFGAIVLLWVLNWRLLRPIDRLKRQASAMAQPGARPASRVDWLRHDELGELGQHLNLAHDRLDSLLAELESSNAELHRMAMVDQLTGLPNRRLFRELFDHALAAAKRSQQPMALMFIDLDRFKHINDTLGHPAGDELLRTLGQRLRQMMRGSDIVGRLSGDEFIALLPDVKGSQAIGHTALRVIHAIEAPVPLPEKSVQMQVSASVGVAMFPADGGNFDDLLRHADQAMYRAKAAGRGRYMLFREPGRADTPKPGGDAELAMALTRRELLLHYQPVIDTHTGRAVGAEALLRWQHPSQGLLPPARFIHRAEECGQIHALEQHALRSACEQLAQWKAAGLQTGSMAVNLSIGEFRHEHLPGLLARAMQDHHLGAGELELELSSHTMMSDPEFTQARVDELRAMGVSLVLEDVGSSMVSLARLGQLHPARIKIDATLVSRLPEDQEARTTVNAIVQLARSLGVGVAASGVETEAQRDALTEAGCHWQQGFFFARPAPASNEPQWATHRGPQHPAVATVLAPGTFDQRALRPAANASNRSKPH
ncbi:MAG TPA: EAL domain-containing protein [Ideonella sp.]|uniref:putative bifunctional diguanylate cyclase/phosphodiesterase n=1 Tax=Ideonella sp. TaxID=1929293 RepID=UPI002E36C83F|nr:EAL domain-containing protein [Ideonella sp.]HEX5686038.1 EAL domain-containing protein [Ideonella sp.]